MRLVKVKVIWTRSFSSTRTQATASRKKNHWAAEANRTTNVDRAFQHFDDLYASVYNTRWHSMRLGLLSPQKYIAIPNSFADRDVVSRRLESLGAYDLKSLWDRGREKLKLDKPTLNPTKEATRLDELDKTLESIAKTKVAEEMETLYQNATSEMKIPGVFEGEGERRVLGDIREAVAEFIPPTKLKGIEDFQMESEYYSVYQDEQTPSPLANSEGQSQPRNTEAQPQSQLSSIYKFTDSSNYTSLHFPFLKPYTFEAGSSSNFPSAGRNSQSGLRDWLCVNGASLVPIIALELTPEVNMLDLCSGPGTKSLLSLMTTCPATLTCNDLESSRLARVKRIFEEFTGTGHPSNVIFTRYNASNYPCSSIYQRVLADVPCSSDRVSATVSDNSIFKTGRTRERLNLVKIQKSILLSAFSCLSKSEKSVCVYSTCTLSPIENDGTVGAALRESTVPDLIVDLEGLWESLLPFKAMDLFSISRSKFGVIVEPTVFSNFGPMYVSRILHLPPSSGV